MLLYTVRDNYTLKSHKYMCITTYQPDTKSNPKPNPNSNPTTKQLVIVKIQLSIVTCPTHPDKFIRDNVVAPSTVYYTLGCNCHTARSMSCEGRLWLPTRTTVAHVKVTPRSRFCAPTALRSFWKIFPAIRARFMLQCHARSSANSSGWTPTRLRPACSS